MRQLISSGSPFEAEAGYSRAVAEGEWVFVAGTTGFDYARMTIAEDPAEQARQAFRNTEKALSEAGGALADVVRVRYYVPDIADWPAIVPVLGEVFGAIRPAATALVCGLVDPRMKIEIEGAARRGIRAGASPHEIDRRAAHAARGRPRFRPHPAGTLCRRAGSRGAVSGRGVGRARQARLYGHAGARRIWRSWGGSCRLRARHGRDRRRRGCSFHD